MRWVYSLVFSLVVACSKEKPSPTPVDASRPVVDAALPRRPASNLLYTTNAVVAVSSKVDNPKDFPEHLVDGKSDTAWNGKTGDLNGWIQFRIPAPAHVEAISLIVGFDKKAKNGDDLFVMNHRITKVRVSSAGKTLAETTLDPNVRTPQAIKLGAPGGDFRIDVLETAPGTKKEWRELVVSELAVWGEPNAAALAEAHLPKVYVGSLDPPDASAPAQTPATPAKARAVANVGRAPSLDAFCTDHTARVEPAFDAGANEYPGFIDPPYCEPIDAQTVRITDYNERHENLVVTTSHGVVVTGVVLDSRDLRNPGCGGSCVVQQKSVAREKTSKGNWVVALVDHHCWMNPMPTMDGIEGTSGSSTYTEVAYVCLVPDDGEVSCTKWDDAKEEYGAYREFDDDFARVTWTSVRQKKVKEDGTLVFE